ncbi:type II toxin-antitoxin system RelE/ParE family toxin [uncultured Parasutterella sp.]
MNVMIVKELPSFSHWIRSIRDRQMRNRILDRIARLSDGLFGDSHSVGSGVSELRLNFGPGYRVYYTIRGDEIVILLIGGDKSSQSRDIEKAKSLAKEIL